jgi:predicted transcriptional regulator
MTAVEELKTYLHNAIEAEGSEEVLLELQSILERKLPMLSEELEAEVAIGMAEIDAGEYVTLDEFLVISKKEAEELKKKFSI